MADALDRLAEMVRLGHNVNAPPTSREALDNIAPELIAVARAAKDNQTTDFSCGCCQLGVCMPECPMAALDAKLAEVIG